jgi:hypothetical protein
MSIQFEHRFSAASFDGLPLPLSNLSLELSTKQNFILRRYRK